MKDKKLQVFVSSTFTDLKEERQAAVEAVLSSGNIPAGMELFAAGDESQMAVIERWIDESDVYLLILGGRYGSIEPKTGKSYTRLEYEYALSKCKPLFAVVMNDSALESKVRSKGSSVIENENPKELRSFKELVTKNLVRFWDDKKDIKIAIHETLSDFGYRKELVGWIRGDNVVNTAVVAEEMARLTKENAELRNKIANGSNNALYVGFSYDQLAVLLKKELFQINDIEHNVFDSLYELGSTMVNGISRSSLEDSIRNILVKYRIIDSGTWVMGNMYTHRFTEDGHNFYLKMIYNETQEK